MNIIINGHNMFKILIVTFLCSVCLVPLAKVVAKHIGAIDMPNERKVHKKPMPRLGGLAIYLTFLIFIVKKRNLFRWFNNNTSVRFFSFTFSFYTSIIT